MEKSSRKRSFYLEEEEDEEQMSMGTYHEEEEIEDVESTASSKGMPNVWLQHQDAFLSILEEALNKQLVHPTSPHEFWLDFTKTLCTRCGVQQDPSTFRDAQHFARFLKNLNHELQLKPLEPTVYSPEFKNKLSDMLAIYPICTLTGPSTSMALPVSASMDDTFDRRELKTQLIKYFATLVYEVDLEYFNQLDKLSMRFDAMGNFELSVFLGMSRELQMEEVQRILRTTRSK